MLIKANYESPIGSMIILADAENLLGLWFEGQRNFGGQENLDLVLIQENKITHQVKNWLDQYFAGDFQDLAAIPLKFQLTEFQQRVVSVLLQVPVGKTISYSKIATQLGQAGHRTSPRAVGNAVARNPFLILVPCHRVVGNDGSLTGYAAGIAKKKWLLAHESKH